MGRMLYLLSLNMSGIKCIEKDIRIDFYGKQINKRFDPKNSNIKVIYGENGVGKTAIISAVDIVKEFVINENYLRELRNQALLNEFINKKTRAFAFKCEFVSFIETLYIFEYEVRFSFNEEGDVYVSYESLKYKKNSSKNVQSTAFICENGELVEINVEEKERIIDNTKNLLTKQSALYLIFKTIAQEKIKTKEELIYIYAIVFFLMLFVHFDIEDRHISFYQRKRFNELKRNQLPIDSLIEEIDHSIPTNEKRIAIKDYDKYSAKIIGLEKFIKLFKPALKKIDIDKSEDKEFYICKMIMDYGEYRIDSEFESTGIKHLIEMYDALKLASSGAIVFIDEIDANINDVMLNKMIEYFKVYSDGQLCITSHNTEPMNVLKDNNKAIDFLTSDNKIVSWVKNGHYSPEKCYRNGFIEGSPFNIDSTDFINVFEEG